MKNPFETHSEARMESVLRSKEYLADEQLLFNISTPSQAERFRSEGRFTIDTYIPNQTKQGSSTPWDALFFLEEMHEFRYTGEPWKNVYTPGRMKLGTRVVDIMNEAPPEFFPRQEPRMTGDLFYGLMGLLDRNWKSSIPIRYMNLIRNIEKRHSYPDEYIYFASKIISRYGRSYIHDPQGACIQEMIVPELKKRGVAAIRFADYFERGKKEGQPYPVIAVFNPDSVRLVKE